MHACSKGGLEHLEITKEALGVNYIQCLIRGVLAFQVFHAAEQ
jgi:hypothetical protein